MKVKVSTLYKAFCAIFATYYAVIMMVFSSLRGYLLPLGAMMVAFFIIIIIESNQSYKDILSVPITSWLLFAALEMIVSIFVAINLSYAAESLFTFVKLIVMCMCLAYVAILDGNADFLIKLMYFDSLLYVFFMIITQNKIGGRLAIINANGDANVCLIGIVTGSMIINKEKNIYRLIIPVSTVLMIYANLMTGSRKSFFCMVFYIAFWIITELRTSWKTLKNGEKIGVLLIFSVVVYMFIKFGLPFFYTSNTYLRMTNSYALNSDMGRFSLYREAWQHFIGHPIFGIGYNQFRLYNAKHIYSHSTYAEILACGGITGTILFFTPHVWMVVKLLRFIKEEPTYEDKKRTLLILIYVISSLFLAAGMVQTSNERVLMMYGIIFGYILAKEKTREAEQVLI